MVHDLLGRNAERFHDHLQLHGAHALPDARGGGMQMHLAILHFEAAAPGIGDADAHARVLHRAGNARLGVALHDRSHRVERFDQRGRFVRDLPVREHLPRPDRVAVADLERCDADHLRQLIQIALGRKAALRDAEAAERARGRVVRVDRLAVDVDVLIVIRPRGVRTGALQHRPAERRVGAGIGNERRAHGG